MKTPKEIEKLTQDIGRSLLKDAKQTRLFDKNLLMRKALHWTMESDSFKTRLFRFIDVLPSLKDPEDVLSHLKEYFKEDKSPWLASIFKLSRMTPGLAATTIKNQVREVAKIFIAGASPKDALQRLRHIRKQGWLISIDILGEATLSEKEAKDYQSQYLNLMDTLIAERRQWIKNNPNRNEEEKTPSLNISVKPSALFSQIREEAWKFSKNSLKDRLRPIFKKAADHLIFINMDMESYRHKTLFTEIFKELLMEPDFASYPHFGIVIQAYLKESVEDLKSLKVFCEKRKVPVTVRLVRGAYWDSEVIYAKQRNWPIPVYTRKEETDWNFERCTDYLLRHHQVINTALGSHNIRSLAKALALHKNFPESALEFQFLYGMGENLAHGISKRGHPVRFYTAIGELIPGMSYLVRRLLENTANQSFIKNLNFTKVSPEELLRSPDISKPLGNSTKSFSKQTSLSEIKEATKLKNPEKDFINHPERDFTIRENRENFQNHLSNWNKKLPLKVPLIINGEEIFHSQTDTRVNPGRIKQTVSHVTHASTKEAEQAVTLATQVFPEWGQTPLGQRIEKLNTLALLLKSKELELAALEVLEVGKTWSEAQKDIAEAIDFCNYYASSIVSLQTLKKTMNVMGEESFSQYEPLGPSAVIAPWNFPLAILTGMTVAPLICGNPVLIKPAEQSSLIAYEFTKLLLESGFPPTSFAFLPGSGEVVGNFLVRHPAVPLISFTGSFEVGSNILKEASLIRPKQKLIKRCVVEMGGKNSIIVDESADLDEAVLGVIESAFGFQGQKCSACSKAVVLKGIYNRFLDRLLPSVESLIVCNTEDPKAFIGPVIDKIAFEKIQGIINSSTQKLFQASNPLKEGYYINPAVFATQDMEASLLTQEIFGPVLAVLKADNMSQAITFANDSPFGLTAGLYSRHPGHIEKFKTLIDAGNVYINRNCTGALVKRHPFGGRKMSGSGSKAGGPEYLKQFLIPKITTENTTRRGFSPEVFSWDII